MHCFDIGGEAIVLIYEVGTHMRNDARRRNRQTATCAVRASRARATSSTQMYHALIGAEIVPPSPLVSVKTIHASEN